MEVFKGLSRQWRFLYSIRGVRCFSDDRHTEPPIPDYDREPEKNLETRKARLQYQSRKRGMLENDLILSTFANRFLKEMDLEMVEQYDRLINLPSNDWDIYYWATGVKPVPQEYDNKIMQLLKEHVTNTNREVRIRQPELQQMR